MMIIVMERKKKKGRKLQLQNFPLLQILEKLIQHDGEILPARPAAAVVVVAPVVIDGVELLYLNTKKYFLLTNFDDIKKGLLEFLGQQPDLGFDPKDPNCINRVFTSLPIFFFFFWIILLSDQK